MGLLVLLFDIYVYGKTEYVTKSLLIKINKIFVKW